MDLDASEVRVLGCLIEKQRRTPDAYPLTLNALRLACNQSTNREPVVHYDDATIRAALHRLVRRNWARLASGPGSRAPKYRHLLGETLGLAADELSVLAVLALRGPQTAGELRQHAERLHPLADPAALEEVLGRLSTRGLALRLERRPGQKEERFAHLLDDEADALPSGAAPAAGSPAGPVTVAPEPPASAPPVPAVGGPPVPERIDALERELSVLREEVAALRRELSEIIGVTELVD